LYLVFIATGGEDPAHDRSIIRIDAG
jgi:hypothetical protein